MFGIDVAFFFNSFSIYFGFAYALWFSGNDVHTDFACYVFRAFELNQYAFGSQSTVDVGNQLVGSVDHLEAANRHVLAQFSDDGFAFCFNQFTQFFNRSRFFLGSSFSNEVGKFYEAGVFSNEVGFAVYFNQCADIAVDRISQYAFGSSTASQFTGFRTRFNTQDFFGFVEVAFSFNQGFFAFHHAQAGSGAQVGNHFCSNFCHFESPRFLGTRPLPCLEIVAV